MERLAANVLIGEDRVLEHVVVVEAAGIEGEVDEGCDIARDVGVEAGGVTARGLPDGTDPLQSGSQVTIRQLGRYRLSGGEVVEQ
jgi:hypothetical protein